MLIQPFETPHLIHRPFTSDDLDDLARWYADPAMMRYLGDGSVRTREWSAAALEGIQEQYRTHGLGLFASVDKATGRLVGRSGFFVWPSADSIETELGYMIDSAFQGRGYATETARGFVAQALAQPAWPRPYLVAYIQPANVASIRVAEQSGFRFWEERAVRDYAARVYRIDLARR